VSFAYIANHTDQAFGRLLEFYKGKPRVVALLRAFAQRSQVVEDTLAQLKTGLLLFGNGAVGAQLDAIGQIVGIARNGTSDGVYRILILGSIAKNYSSGSLETLTTLCQTLYQTPEVYVSTPNSPGHAREAAYGEIILSVGNPKTDAALFPVILNIVLEAMPAGVRLVSVSTFTGQAICAEGPQSWVAGFSELSGQGGGNLATVLYQA
jgi:hypothetical protein